MSGESKPAAGSQSPLLNRPDMSIEEMNPVARRRSLDDDRPNMSMRIVLVGKTGAGKSASANTILGRRVFLEGLGWSSITKECRKEGGEVAESEVIVVDTPGLFDTARSEESIKQEIGRCINMTAPGPHAIIVVVRLGAFTREERQSVEKVRALFGEDADRYTMVLFTYGDELACSIDEYINNASPDLKYVLELCGGRHHVFDNTDMKNRTQVVQLLKKMDKMVADNRGEFYTNDMYQHVEGRLNIEEEGMRKNYSEELREKESHFEEERKRLYERIAKLNHSGQEKDQKIKELEECVHENDLQIKEYRRFYKQLQLAVRAEAERSSVIVTLPELYDKLQRTRITEQ